MTFAGRYCTCELQLQFFCVYMYYCAFKPICGLGLGLGLASYGVGLSLGLVKSVLFPSLDINPLLKTFWTSLPQTEADNGFCLWALFGGGG